MPSACRSLLLDRQQPLVLVDRRRRLDEAEHLDLVELVHAEDPARVAPGGARLAPEARREARVAQRQLVLARGSRPACSDASAHLARADEVQLVVRQRVDLLLGVGQEAGAVQRLLAHEHRRDDRLEAVPAQPLQHPAHERELEQHEVAAQVGEPRARQARAALHVDARARELEVVLRRGHRRDGLADLAHDGVRVGGRGVGRGSGSASSARWSSSSAGRARSVERLDLGRRPRASRAIAVARRPRPPAWPRAIAWSSALVLLGAQGLDARAAARAGARRARAPGPGGRRRPPRRASAARTPSGSRRMSLRSSTAALAPGARSPRSPATPAAASRTGPPASCGRRRGRVGALARVLRDRNAATSSRVAPDDDVLRHDRPGEAAVADRVEDRVRRPPCGR